MRNSYRYTDLTGSWNIDGWMAEAYPLHRAVATAIQPTFFFFFSARLGVWVRTMLRAVYVASAQSTTAQSCKYRRIPRYSSRLEIANEYIVQTDQPEFGVGTKHVA